MDARLKNFPKELVDQWLKLYPPGQINSIFKAYLFPRITSLRVNTIKSSPEEIVKYFTKNNLNFEKDKHIPGCFYLKALSLKKLMSLDVFQQGKIYLQNPASQLPPLVLSPKPGDSVLDLCASPGSKTSQLAALTHNLAQIVALEPDRIRFARLNHNLLLLGCSCVETHNTRGESFAKRHIEEQKNLFDKVLVDAPCSGDGTFYVNSRAGFSHWSVDFVNKISRLQKKLLEEAVALTKPQGRILYSTCATSFEENEGVVDFVLKNNPGVSVLPISRFFSFPFFQKGITTWNGCHYTKSLENTIRLFPSDKLEGFYMALLKKN